ncbi:phosphate ABC transporter permease subunit PstC [Hoyosella rhizosphaerae]|uniref:Phosphate transport system permease protein n=1 Tax=Hoyosella rhizosphaerae TaxID=1755582 RepID=A0A916UGK6_9ACTN|nr:phosphate ABC transporter permease subunit PstC [Hoyosella rhizosphaerae]MBN4928034.1 phosphate ABC transporter permease subunit PstC [Hoyosella rhizosphaerae]GGC71882.1 phosphate transport system permease protein [Hoyosella rhizosphaerae]
MSVVTPPSGPELRNTSSSRFADPIFRWTVTIAGTTVLILLALMVIRTTQDAWPVFQKEGFFGFLFGTTWEAGYSRTEITGTYGAWPFIYGTVVVAIIAMIIALPLAIAVALYLTQLAPLRLRNPLSYTVEMLAAVPSIIFGMWGFFWLLPNVLRPYVLEPLEKAFGWFFLFEGPVFGVSYLSAGIVLAIMILPIMTAIFREVFTVNPIDQQHAAYGLGATRFEVMRKIILPSSLSGIVGGSMLGLGRALGETVAVLFLIGSTQKVSTSLLQGGDSMAAHIAATFQDASPESIRGLMAIGVALFVVTMIVNVVARLIVWRLGRMTGDSAV